MERITDMIEFIIRYLMLIKISDVLDVAVMAFALYMGLKLVKSSRVANLLKGLFIFLVGLWLSDFANLNGVHLILSKILELGGLALIVLFQPELRSILEQAGSSRLKIFSFLSKAEKSGAMESAILQTVSACMDMSKSRTGALIVFERDLVLDDMVRSGTVLDAAVSGELLKNIFFCESAYA